MWYYFYTGLVFSRERCVLLDVNSLELFKVVDKDNSQLIMAIPYDEIATIKLGWERRGKDVRNNEYYCEIIDKSSKRKIKFFSWGDKYYYPKYIEFLYALHTACQQHKHIKYVCTKPPNSFVILLEVLLISVSIVFFLVPLFAYIFGFYGVRLCIGLCALYYFKFYEAPTSPYHPDYIPKKLLPKC
jgi:hypothetical protein